MTADPTVTVKSSRHRFHTASFTADTYVLQGHSPILAIQLTVFKAKSSNEDQDNTRLLFSDSVV